MAKKPIEIDACAGSQLRDTQGEMLSVEGADISELEAGRGRWNDNHGKGFFNSIGRITEAHKIFKAEDCQNERHKYYWEKVKAPYIYVRGILYDDEDHPNAKAAAAILRNIHKSDAPLRLKASVEGGVVQRGLADPSLLARTKIHSIALTFTPANNATLVEPINLNKSAVDVDADMELIKSVMHLAQTDIPSFRHITRDASASRVVSNMEKIADILGEGAIVVPSKAEVISRALEAKIEDNVRKIHAAIDELVQEEMEKVGIKDAIAGAAMLGTAAAMSPGDAAAKPPQAMKMPPTPVVQQLSGAKTLKDMRQEVFKKRTKDNLSMAARGLIESEGGANPNHKRVYRPGAREHGMQAAGSWGIMPDTASTAFLNDPVLVRKYPKMFALLKNSDLTLKNHRMITHTLNNNPEMEADVAFSEDERRKKQLPNDEHRAFSWNMGFPKALHLKATGKEKIMLDHEYTQKYRAAMQRLSQSRLPASASPLTAKDVQVVDDFEPSMNKATDVFQNEELEKGIKNWLTGAATALSLAGSMTPAHAASGHFHSFLQGLNGVSGVQISSKFKPFNNNTMHGAGSYNIQVGPYSVVGRHHTLPSGDSYHKHDLVGPKTVSPEDEARYKQDAVNIYHKVNDIAPKALNMPDRPVKKALTAGYGGAGAPAGRFGGSVFQAESLEDSKAGLKNVTCDDCGKDQIYSKFQVKCRHCNKSWSLDKLHKIMSSGKKA
jgi:hypothetical protein